MTAEVILQVKNLKKYFPINTGLIMKRKIGDVKAVDEVSFEIYRGETLGLVGESGCGKSTTGLTLLQLERPTAGRVEFEGQDLTEINGKALRHMRRRMQMIFQDPYASLNPRMTVGNIIGEAMTAHGITSTREERDERVRELLALVGLNPHSINLYPHEFSGGQRQRIGIARALALEPSFIVCDEPISALDVSIQAQIINLLQRLREQFDLTYLFIAHDLSMVRHFSDRVAVMYLGKIVELTDRDTLYSDPRHPYTQALLSAVPIPDPLVEKNRQQITLVGDVPSPSNPPTGCNFNTRCRYARDECFTVEPEYCEESPGHWVACHFSQELPSPE